MVFAGGENVLRPFRKHVAVHHGTDGGVSEKAGSRLLQGFQEFLRGLGAQGGQLAAFSVATQLARDLHSQLFPIPQGLSSPGGGHSLGKEGPALGDGPVEQAFG